MMHVTNGDSVAGSLRRSGVPGDVVVWAEVLHEGPVLLDVSDEEWRWTRASFYAQNGWGTYDENLARLRAWDEPLERVGPAEEAVFWLEHDLFDQLLLIRHLWWNRRRNSEAWLSLICIDRHDAVDPFFGLGQLAPEQLRPLLGERQPVDGEQTSTACRAWEAFAASDPRRIEEFLAGETSALPFLAAALRRHLEQFPWVGDGLSRSERQALRVIGSGCDRATAAFVAAQMAEPAPFLGDSTFFGYLQRLASGPAPLLTIDGRTIRDARVELTAAGRRVLDGRADWLALNSLDERWLGGVRVGGAHPWRWDAGAGRITAG